MTVNIAIIGCGFMGSTHFQAYQQIPGAKVVAVCDKLVNRINGDWGSISGNIDNVKNDSNLNDVTKYTKIDDCLQDPQIDVIDICLPTPNHESTAIAAFEAGKHVICEKPLARDSVAAKRIIDAADYYNKKIYVSQCIRFWPSYAALYEIIQNKTYGNLRSANFRRLSPQPGWSDWILDPIQSGGCALDMHVHDSDFVNYCFGKPTSVSSNGYKHKNGRIDHIITHYHYDTDCFISTEGSWIYAPDLPFSMTFTVDFEHATVTGDHERIQIYLRDGGNQQIDIESGNGYDHELRDFISCINAGTSSAIVSAESALSSIKIIEAEITSFDNNGSVVAVL